jgi:hypothetical protein
VIDHEADRSGGRRVRPAGLPYVDRPYFDRPYDRPYPKLPNRKKALVVMAVIVAVLVGGIWWYRGWFGGHVTECGVDAKGPYAKVRVGSLLGGRGSIKHEGVSVLFTYDGHGYALGGSRVKVPMFGSTTVFVRGTWPPRVIDLDYDGGPKGKITVPGRAVGGHWVNTSVALQRRWHIRPQFKAIVEPNDLGLLGCGRVLPPTNGWQ